MRTTTALATGTAAGLAVVLAATCLDNAPPATAAPAPAAAESYAGHGWDIDHESGLRSLSPAPIEIVFTSTRARGLIGPYLTGPAAQAADITGTPIEVTDRIVPAPAGDCPARGTITVELAHQPIGKPGYSWGGVCRTDRGVHHSGHIKITTEWFKPGPTDTDRTRANGVAHELGHALGLDHPNTDLDGDGELDPRECVRTADGLLPLMCSPNNGHPAGPAAGRFTELDAAGLRALTTNHTRSTP